MEGTENRAEVCDRESKGGDGRFNSETSGQKRLTHAMNTTREHFYLLTQIANADH